MKSVLHDGQELLLTEFTISISVKQLEDNMDQMLIQHLTSTCFDCTAKVSYRNTNYTHNQLVTVHKKSKTFTLNCLDKSNYRQLNQSNILNHTCSKYKFFTCKNNEKATTQVSRVSIIFVLPYT